MILKNQRYCLFAFALLLLCYNLMPAQKGVLASPEQLIPLSKESTTARYLPSTKAQDPGAVARITTVNPIPLGTMGNVFSSFESMNNCVYANDTTGVAIFIHRNNQTVFGGTSFGLRYDITTDRGVTWTNDLGILNPTNLSGRYPQIAGYNPPANTAPLGGRAIWLAEYFDSTAWAGFNAGSSELVTTGTPATQELLLATTEQLPSGGMTQGLPGEYWAARFTSSAGALTDSLNIYKGTYNPGGLSIAWALHSSQPIAWDMSIMGFANGVAPSVAFSPDGSIGWIAALGDLTGGVDSAFSPILIKSTNGGASWGSPVEIDLNTFPWVYDSLRSLWIDSLGQPSSSGSATAAFDYDLTVDAAGNPHMFFVIATLASNSAYAIVSGLAKYAVDLTSSNQGSSFDLRLVAPVLTFRTSTYGATTTMTMDNYPQISRTHDGNYIFYTWVDTDTALVTGSMNGIGFGQSDNLEPNAWMAGLRVADGYFTCIQPITAQDLVWNGRAINPQLAPEVFVSGSGPSAMYNLPMVIAEMPALEPADPCNNYYFGNDAVLTESQFSFAPGSTITWGGCGVSPGVAAHIRGKVFADYNANGLFDGADVPMPGNLVSTTGIVYADVTDANGDYSILCAPNLTYGVLPAALNPTAWMPTSPAVPYSLTPVAMGNLTGNDFGFTPIANIEDLSVSMTFGLMRSGFNSGGNIYVTNLGTQASTGVLTWTYDSLITLVSANPTFATNDTVLHVATWNLPLIPVFGTEAIHLITHLPIGVPINTSLDFHAQVVTAGTDVNPYNNIDNANVLVVGSFDPNDKAVTPAGVGTSHQVMPGTELAFRIRCQNTGNASAINVIVRDTLDADLDITTFKMLEASHPYTLTIENGHILVWDFSGINLPDSFSNEPASHAHIDFKISPKANRPNGTVIENDASIYFDFNAPVLTNTAWITYDIPSGIASSNLLPSLVRIYPHPVGDRATIEFQRYDGKPWTLELYDLQGRQILQVANLSAQTFEFERGKLPAGTYVYKVSAGGHMPKVGKLSLQ